MGDLSLALLGPPEVRHADQVLLFSTRKELALLIFSNGQFFHLSAFPFPDIHS